MNEIERQYWLWVTRPDYYLEDDGSDREILDPTHSADAGGWWTCHKDTKRGDLIFLWRTSPKKDIGYLIQAESDAYSIADDNDHGWDYGCDYEVLYKFENPIQIKDLRISPSFDEWGPLKGSFQKTTFRISLEYWNKLNNLAASKNPGYQEIIELIQKEPLAEGIRLEEELENELVTNLNILKKFGHHLELYVDPMSKQTGRQFICKGNGGRIDLLCYDKTLKRYAVIELKNVRAGQNTFGQISNYMGWVQNRIAGNIPVIGIVISRGYDTRFESALKITDKISHIDVEKDLGFAVAPTKKIQDIIQPRPKDASPAGIKFAKTREAKTWIKKGDNLFDEAKYDEAIACYDMALGKDPKNKWALINKGVALAELSKYQDTILCFDKLAEIYPKSAQVWDSKGIALNRLNKFEEAIDAFDRVIELKPKLADPWNSKGFVLYNLKKYDGAVQAYDKAIEIDPKDALIWSNKGDALLALSKYDDAIHAYDRAIELDPKNAVTWNGRGIALADQNKYDEAIKAFDKAIEIDPKNAVVWYNKGCAIYDKGEDDGAINAIEKAIEIDPNYADTWYSKGKILEKQGKHDEAIEAYDEAIKVSDEAIKLDPLNAETWNTKGYALYEKGKYDEAISASDKAIELNPNDESAWSNKGHALYEQGKYDEALNALDKAITINPKYAKAWNKKGEALKSISRTTEADAALAKAKELGYKG